MITTEMRANLILSYDRQAEQRNKSEIEDWKAIERAEFLELLKSEQNTLFLKSAPGMDGTANSFRRKGFR